MSPAGLRAPPYHPPCWTLPFLEADNSKPTLLSVKIPLSQHHSSTLSMEEPELYREPSSSPPAMPAFLTHWHWIDLHRSRSFQSAPPHTHIHQDHNQVGKSKYPIPTPPTLGLSSLPPPKSDARNRNPTDRPSTFPRTVAHSDVRLRTFSGPGKSPGPKETEFKDQVEPESSDAKNNRLSLSFWLVVCPSLAGTSTSLNEDGSFHKTQGL